MKMQPRGWPAMLSITGPEGGHLLVVDGFDEADEKYHLNLGWGVLNPAQVWYSLRTELPQGYNVINLAVLNISPPPQQNNAPEIVTTPVTTATQGVLYTYDVDATDPDPGDTDTLTYLLTTFPTGMEINSNTGVIQWTPTSAQVGVNDVEVQVQDQAGVTDTQPFTITVAAVELVVLDQGWTFISTRLNPTDPSPSSVFSEIEADCIAIWAYYGNPRAWKRYIPGGADNLGDIEPGRGYCVKMAKGRTLTITGQEITGTERDIELSARWNLVGYNFSGSRSPASALSGIDYSSIWTYVGGVWLKHIKGADFLDTLTLLNRGVGYWIFMENGGKWIVSP